MRCVKIKRLPIENILPDLRKKLNSCLNIVIVAPPGAGKTTRIPLALLDEPWLAGRRILMLEPRRLAARSAARYMAAILGEQVGETVGYRIRLDTCIGSKTRIEVITEGILTRMLQADPGLENVGIVIFDEFHERSVHADLGLAFCLQAQAVLREDLKIMVMSATLDPAPVAEILGKAPIIMSEGISFPVETHYLSHPIGGRMERAVVQKIQAAIAEDYGDILVFLPGVGDIHRVESRLREIGIGKNIVVAKLYGTLTQESQDLAILPERLGKRKIVLATSIAETSITVEGVRVVIDSGLMRVPRFSPRTGMTHLETITASLATADQRRGRAGRLESGVCYRLWTRQEELAHDVRNTPEILSADLAPLALELAAWGIVDPAELLWLDLPPKASFNQAYELLNQLGALSLDGHITPYGRSMSKVGLHPRLAHMILRAIPLGYGSLACEIAALIGQRDILQGEEGAVDADLRLRIDVIRRQTGKLKEGVALEHKVDVKAYRRIQDDICHLKQVFAISQSKADDYNACGILLAFAYPDRIGQGRGNGRFLLRNGRGAAFKESQTLAEESYVVAAELGGEQGSENRIFLAAPINEDELKAYCKENIESQDIITWNHEAQAVRARRYERLGALVLENRCINNPDPEKVLSALVQGIREEGLAILPWTKAAQQFRQRLCFMHHFQEDWPDVSEQELLKTLEEWLGPYLYGMSSREHLERLHMITALESRLNWQQRQHLDDWAPTHIVVPSGQRIPIDYSQPAIPVLAVRLQEMFGLEHTPLIGKGKVPLTLHLLSPAHRPVQVTKDLTSFWKNAYFEVKKDLMGRYPKHYWPDNPLEAMPTHRVRPRC